MELDLPEVIVVPGAPAALAGWLSPFLLVLIALSIALKILWRVH